LRRIILAELPGIVVKVNEGEAFRHRLDVGRQRQREQIAAGREQHVVLFEDFADRPLHARHRAAKQWVRRRERRRRRHEFAIDRRADQFGEFDQFGMRFRARHRIAGDDQRSLGLRQDRRGFLHRRRIAAQLRRNPRRRQQIEFALGFENVAGQRQEHRPGWRCQRRLRRAVHEPRQVGKAMHFGRPFHQRSCDRRQVGPQDRLSGVEILIVLSGGDQDRASGFLRVIEHAHRIAEARRDVKIDHGELAGGLRIAVGHADHARLLQREHVA
jgi:hypothetical protein